MELNELSLPPKKESQLNKKKIFSVEDLLGFFPRKYYDFRIPKNLGNVKNGERCSMIVMIKNVNKKQSSKRLTYVEVICRDVVTNGRVTVRWFHQDYKYDELYNLCEMEAVVCGKFQCNEYGASFLNPDVFTTDTEGALAIYPIYSKIAGMSDSYLVSTIDKAFEIYQFEETASEKAFRYFNILPINKAYSLLHHPNDPDEIGQAHRRMVFNQLYSFAYELIKNEECVNKKSSYIPKSLTNCNKLIQSLPYDLTEDQKNILKKFIAKSRRGERVHALLQGDVGSGKTVVAFLLMLSMSDNGYQSVLMAPTGILARQHYEELSSYIKPYELKAIFLSGDVKGKAKTAALRMIKSGEADFIVGTHAVISKDVEFHNLGLTVVDEEHKFGVLQREALQEKAQEGVHSISMSATPIPRSLALTMYGESFDIFTIQTMPSGRKPVDTRIFSSDEDVFSFMSQELSKGHQAYIVCPLIDDKTLDDEDKTPPESVTEVFEKARKYFPEDICIDVITGKMKDDEKANRINEFKENRTHILIATTIIEVGVNVPNATVIAIMDADRFGLAGLHQLRGRVGRNSLQSYCLLKSNDVENDRLKAMCETTNGFEIAQKDLALRGTGEFVGTRQSGNDVNVELALKYPRFYQGIKNLAREEFREKQNESKAV